jgi:hypothetical protein
MWIERPPIEGETVKVVFAEFTEMGTRIGIFLRYFGDKAVVDFGKQHLYLDKTTTFYVFTR